MHKSEQAVTVLAIFTNIYMQVHLRIAICMENFFAFSLAMPPAYSRTKLTGTFPPSTLNV